jgi:hypothetical protein
MRLKILLLVKFCFLAVMLFAQQQATTESGRKVTLYPDGTWKYVEETKKQPDRPVQTSKPPEVIVSNPNLPAGCSELFETGEDFKTGVSITRTRNIIFIGEDGSNEEINISMQKGAKNVITIYFRVRASSQCIGEGGKINITFTDGSKADLSHDGYYNCAGESYSGFNGPFGRKKILEELRTKKIRSIRVWTQSKSVQKELSPANQEEFLKVLNCLAAQ